MGALSSQAAYRRLQEAFGLDDTLDDTTRIELVLHPPQPARLVVERWIPTNELPDLETQTYMLVAEGDLT